MVHLLWHHYGLSDKQIRRMTLRRIVDAINDIGFTNPHCVPPKAGAQAQTPPINPTGPQNPAPEQTLSPEQQRRYEMFGRSLPAAPADS